MKTTSASRADDAAPGRSILVWDLPVRVAHWLMALSFAGAYLTAESERWRLVHVTLGYTLAGLVVFRLLWGLVGTRHARFAAFVRGPAAAARYLGALLRGQPEHHTGHNPAGAWAIVALLLLAAGLSASGWAVYADLGGHGLEEAHELLAHLMLAVVVAHIAAVVLSSWLHRDKLVAAMVHGRKAGAPHEAIHQARRGVAALLAAAVLGFWWMQWHSAPSGAAAADRPPAAAHADDEDDDDD